MGINKFSSEAMIKYSGQVIVTFLQYIVSVSLLIIFIKWFGVPAYNRYMKQNVMTVESLLESAPLEAPAVVVCVDWVKLELLTKISFVYM